jgi:hypothetical protein
MNCIVLLSIVLVWLLCRIAGTAVYSSWSSVFYAQYFGCIPQSLLSLAVLQLSLLRYLLPFVAMNGISRCLHQKSFHFIGLDVIATCSDL